MTREHIVATLILVVVLGAVGCVYQFYYKVRLDEYRANMVLRDDLEKALVNLKDTFDGYIPEELVKVVKGAVQPLSEEVGRRSYFFNLADSFVIDPMPEGKIPKLYYEEQVKNVRTDFHQEIIGSNPNFYYPDTLFGAPAPKSFKGREASRREVMMGLRKIHYGHSILRMMLKAKAGAVNEVAIWPQRMEYGGLLSMRTVGIHFTMKLEDLVKFLDSLRLADRYYSVDAISIQNRYLRMRPEPQMDVRMLLTQAAFIAPSRAKKRPAGTAPGTPGLRPGMMTPEQMLAQQEFTSRPRRDRRAPLTRPQRIKRWLKRYFWPF